MCNITIFVYQLFKTIKEYLYCDNNENNFKMIELKIEIQVLHS